jgi:hypothetical protein
MNTPSLQRTSRAPTTPAAMLAKSAVCCALVVGIAWIGFTALAGDATAVDTTVNQAAPSAAVLVRTDSAAAHRRQVFEERRARFEARTPTRLAGRAYLEYPAP